KVYKADNPPAGAIIDYYLKSAPADDVVITVSDRAGKTIRTIRGAPKEPGVNRTTWDLQYDGPRQAPAPGGREGGGGGAGGRGGRFGGAGGGPFVVPGEYTVRVRAAGKELTKTVKVEMDPRVPVSAADLQAQLDASLTLREMTTRANAVVERTTDLIQQLTALQERLKKSTSARAAGSAAGPGPLGSSAPGGGAPQLTGAAKEIYDLVTATLDASKTLLEDELARPYPSMGYRQYPRLREEIQSLSGSVSRTAARPTDPEMLRMKELEQELDDDVAKLNRIQTEQVGKINDAMKTAPFIRVETIR